MHDVSFDQGIYIVFLQNSFIVLWERRDARKRMDISRIGKRNIVDFAVRREKLR